MEIKQGWFVEFGAWDGKHLSNTYALVEKGWKGIEIEGDKTKFEELRKRFNDNKNIILFCKFVEIEGENSIDFLLSQTSIPKNFDLISIDIDGNDWHIWNSLKNYSPKIVIIEIDSCIQVGIEQIHSSIEGKKLSSFSSTLKLGISKGYTLVCHTGNMIFVRNDLIHKLNLPDTELNNPESLFINDFIPKKGLIKFLLDLHFPLKKKSKLYKRFAEKLLCKYDGQYNERG